MILRLVILIQTHLLIVSSLDNPIPRFVMAKGIPVFKEGGLMVSDLLSAQPTMGKRPFKICEIGTDTFRIAKYSSLRTCNLPARGDFAHIH